MPRKKVSDPNSADAASRRGDNSMTTDPSGVLRKNLRIRAAELHSHSHISLDFIVGDWRCECIGLFYTCASAAFYITCTRRQADTTED